MLRRSLTVLVTATLALASLSFEAAPQDGACDRACLKALVDGYLTALSERDFALERASYAGTIVTDRRYPVVDTELGSALAEIFKYTGGRLREIRAVILNLPNGAGTGWTAPR
jgi:hypothetical protein